LLLLPSGSGLQGCPLDVGPGVGKGGCLGPLLLGSVGIGGECSLSFSSLGHEGVGLEFDVDGLSLVVIV
jgi:hypothetical protein